MRVTVDSWERIWHEEWLSSPVSTRFLRAALESTSIMGTDQNSHLPSMRPLSTGLPVSGIGPPRACPSFFPPFILHSIFVFSCSDYCSLFNLPHWVFPTPPLSRARGPYQVIKSCGLFGVSWSLLREVLTLRFNYSWLLGGEQHIPERSHKRSLSWLSGYRSYSAAFCLPYKIFIMSAAAFYRLYLHPRMKKLLSQGHSRTELPFDLKKKNVVNSFLIWVLTDLSPQDTPSSRSKLLPPRDLLKIS